LEHPPVHFTDSGRIDIDMNFFAFFANASTFPVTRSIKPRADGNKYIALINGHIGVPRAMHASMPSDRFALLRIRT